MIHISGRELRLMKLPNSTVGESHCHGAKVISENVVAIIELRASGITHSLGTMIIVKRVITICSPEPTVCFFFPVQWGFWTLHTLLFRKPNEVINRLKRRRCRDGELISIRLFSQAVTHIRQNCCHKIYSAHSSTRKKKTIDFSDPFTFPRAVFVTKYIYEYCSVLAQKSQLPVWLFLFQSLWAKLKYVSGDIHKTVFLGWKMWPM